MNNIFIFQLEFLFSCFCVLITALCLLSVVLDVKYYKVENHTLSLKPLTLLILVIIAQLTYFVHHYFFLRL
jgi:hypothetical protein